MLAATPEGYDTAQSLGRCHRDEIVWKTIIVCWSSVLCLRLSLL